MQTRESDIAAGARYFRAWAKRFRMSARNLDPTGPSDLLYVATWGQLFEEFPDCTELNLEMADQKIAFMSAYVGNMALESRHFERDVKALLKGQSRVRAPKVLGFWFWQADTSKFGAGASS